MNRDVLGREEEIYHILFTGRASFAKAGANPSLSNTVTYAGASNSFMQA